MNGDESRGDAATSDGTDPIAGFYEQHPYPPPVEDLDDYRERWREDSMRWAEYHLLFPGRAFRDDLDVLVAGCGTFQAARHAVRWPNGEVVGIDVSDTSIRHTEELKRRYDLEHLQTRLLSIEQARLLDRDFDLIVCTGVLHHLADPDTGLKALRELLRPGGTMQIAVYAPYGRTGVTMMREYSRLLGIGTSDQDIRDLAECLVEIPREHPLDPLLRNSPDFRRADALADALLNPRDRTYSVPQLLDYVERNGLRFGRWYRQAPYLPQCGALASIPHSDRLARLPVAEQYAAAELFRGSMTLHTALIHRNDDPPGAWRFGIGHDGWLGAVPIRLPDTMVIESGPPPGASAVLINRSHTFTDLVLPLTATEKRIVAAIDGRTVAETAAGAGLDVTQQAAPLRAFLERLLAYDQVVLAPAPDVGAAPES